MTYKYSAYTTDKRIVQGTIDAASADMAESAIYLAGYQRILALREIQPGLSLAKLITSLFGIKTRDVIDFSNQLATLVESGVTLLTAMRLLEGQTSRDSFKKVIAGLTEELRGGSSLSQTFSKYPQAFSHTYCQVIKASEQVGNLEVGLRQAADYMEKQAATKQRVARALAYPALVLVIAAVVTVLLITVALPPLVGLFTSLDVELPLTTRALIAVAVFLVDYKLYVLGGLLILIIAPVGYARLPARKLARDKLLLQAPLIGSITTERNAFHFCQTTSMLLKSGLRLPQTLEIVIQTIGNEVIRQALKGVREKLIQGQGLSQPVAEIGLFPQLLAEMVVVGEKTGTLDTTLATLADYYEQRVDRRIGTLISMIEPILTVAIGLVVVFIALSMITPLYSILRSMN